LFWMQGQAGSVESTPWLATFWRKNREPVPLD